MKRSFNVQFHFLNIIVKKQLNPAFTEHCLQFIFALIFDKHVKTYNLLVYLNNTSLGKFLMNNTILLKINKKSTNADDDFPKDKTINFLMNKRFKSFKFD